MGYRELRLFPRVGPSKKCLVSSLHRPFKEHSAIVLAANFNCCFSKEVHHVLQAYPVIPLPTPPQFIYFTLKL